MAMVLAITAMMMRMTTKETARIATTIASDIETKPSWKAFSVSVKVSASEFLKVRSMLAAICAAASASRMPTRKIPVLLARRGAVRLRVSFR